MGSTLTKSSRTMDGVKLDLSGLKAKVASKLQSGSADSKDSKKENKRDNKRDSKSSDDKPRTKKDFNSKDSRDKNFDGQKRDTRDDNRDYEKREFNGRDNQKRDFNGRENQKRDFNGRDNYQKRDFNNRDSYQKRDFNNRDNKFEKSDFNNRDNKFEKRDFNNRDNKFEKRDFNGRDNQKKDFNNKRDFKDNKFEKKDFSKPEKKEVVVEESLEDKVRREALELGATEEDLKMLEGISDGESEQEFDGESGTLDQGFNDDLSSFMKNIGLEKSEPIVIAEEDVSEQEDSGVEEAKIENREDDEAEIEADEVKENAEEEEVPELEEEEEEQEGEEDEEEDQQPEQQHPSFPKKEELPTHQRIDPTTILNTSKLLIQPQIDWYNVPLDLSQKGEQLTEDQIDRLFQRGKEALEADNKGYYDEFSKTSSQRKFLAQILSDGTLSDKISALTLLIQEAPLHNTKSFEMILGFTNKKSRNSQLQSLNALKDLFINGLLPDRKLRYFKNQPLNMMLSKKHLALFYFEDFLKGFYFQIIQALEKLSHDPIIHVRMNVVSHVFDLLKSKPEQEVNLLRLGVNKIGDIDNKVSSKTSYQILQLEQAHPNMKKIVIDSVIDIVFKQNVDYHTKYYSVLTLNQTILTRREEDIANELVKTYFALLEKLLIESDPHQSDPKGDDKDAKQNNYKNRNKNFKKGKKGGKSVKNVKTDQDVLEEKDSKLFSALLTGVNRAFPFSNLPMEIYNKHLDTMFRITHSSNFNTSVQALMLIFQISSAQNLNGDRFYKTLYESLLDPRLVSSSKQGIYLNLLFKALKKDQNISRVMAFVKRIVQICYNWTNIGPVAGMFYLLMELQAAVPQIRNLAINTPVDHKYMNDEDSEEEHFVDVKSEDEGSDAVEKPKKTTEEYDGRKRDPRFANAANSSIWEINEFLNHYHPTVQLYAESLLSQEKQQKPDLGLFTLSHFLDRFVYRNAKQKATIKGSSIMQPLGGTHTGSLLVKASNTVTGEVPANTENWLERRVEEVRPDERFFFEYFQSKQKDPSKMAEPKEDEFDQESDLDDEEVWDALVKSQPDIDGAESDGGDDLSDLDMSDFSDDEELDEEALEGEIDEVSDAFDASDVSDSELVAAGEDDDESGSEIELQTIGMSDDDEYSDVEGEDEEDLDEEEPAFKGFSESEDEEAELFKDNSDNELSSDEEPAEEPKKGKKRAADETTSNQKEKSKKAKLKALPLFADADEYAKLLDSDED